MSDRIRCHCQRCMIRGLMGPSVVVTLGVLFLLSQLRGGDFDFWHTYPVLLIVIGLISVASAFASNEGHISEPPPISPIAPSAPPVPPAGVAPDPFQGQGQ